MRGSENPEVVKFVQRYNDTLGLVWTSEMWEFDNVLIWKNQRVQIQIWDELAEGEGTVVGFFTPIDRSATKTPMPCVLGWSNSQMFEQTDDVQQCVKVSSKVLIWFLTPGSIYWRWLQSAFKWMQNSSNPISSISKLWACLRNDFSFFNSWLLSQNWIIIKYIVLILIIYNTFRLCNFKIKIWTLRHTI